MWQIPTPEDYEENPYGDIDWNDEIFFTIITLDSVARGYEFENSSKFITSCDKWLQDVRRIRHIISFSPYREQLKHGDITFLLRFIILSYSSLYDPQMFKVPINLRTFLTWFINKRFGVNDIADIPTFSVFYTDRYDAAEMMEKSFRIVKQSNFEEGVFMYLNSRDFEIFKNGSVFLGVCSQGMYFFVNQFRLFISAIYNAVKEESEDPVELIHRINTQMGLINVAGTLEDNLVTISENVIDRIEAIKNEETDSVVILIDEILMDNGGVTFEELLKGLLKQFGDGLMPKIQLYAGSGKVLIYDEECIKTDFHRWKEPLSLSQRILSIERKKKVL